MSNGTDESRVRRRLRFTDDAAATEAVAALAGMPGVQCARAGSTVDVEYAPAAATLTAVESCLGDAGVVILRGPAERLLSALARYAEAVRRDLETVDLGWSGAVRSAYVAHFRSTRHGRRDDRPQQWREYVRESRRED